MYKYTVYVEKVDNGYLMRGYRTKNYSDPLLIEWFDDLFSGAPDDHSQVKEFKERAAVARMCKGLPEIKYHGRQFYSANSELEEIFFPVHFDEIRAMIKRGETFKFFYCPKRHKKIN